MNALSPSYTMHVPMGSPPAVMADAVPSFFPGREPAEGGGESLSLCALNPAVPYSLENVAKGMNVAKVVKKVLTDAAIGAAAGAALATTGVGMFVPVVAAGIKWALIGTGVGTVVGAIIGGNYKASGSGGTMFNEGMKTGAALGAMSGCTIGGVIGSIQNYARRKVVMKIAEFFGGGRMGAAVAGGVISGTYSAVREALKSHRK